METISHHGTQYDRNALSNLGQRYGVTWKGRDYQPTGPIVLSSRLLAAMQDGPGETLEFVFQAVRRQMLPSQVRAEEQAHTEKQQASDARLAALRPLVAAERARIKELFGRLGWRWTKTELYVDSDAAHRYNLDRYDGQFMAAWIVVDADGRTVANPRFYRPLSHALEKIGESNPLTSLADAREDEWTRGCQFGEDWDAVIAAAR